MIVAFDASVLGSTRGGDETLLRGLLTGLAQQTEPTGSGRYQFRLYVRPGADLPPAVVGHPAFACRELPGTSRLWRYAVGLPRALAREPADLLYTQTHAPLAGGPPVVLQLTDLSFRHAPRLYPPLTRLRLNALVPLHARRARAVLAISNFTRQDLLASYGLSPRKVFLVPCALERSPHAPEMTADARGAWLAERGIREPYFLFVGNLHPRKNVRRLVEAFARARSMAPALRQHQLVVVGTGHEFYPRLWTPEQERAVRAALGDSLVLAGRVSDDDRDALLGWAQALAYPSIFEGFGLPPVEAMAAGTPVLASNTTALPEVLGDAALLVDPISVDAIADGLVRLGIDAALREELRARGRARADRYTPRAAAEAALAAFDAALGLRTLAD